MFGNIRTTFGQHFEVLYLREKTRQVSLQQGSTHLNSSRHWQAPSQRAKQQAFLDNFENFVWSVIDFQADFRLKLPIWTV